MNLAEWLKDRHPLAEQIQMMLGIAGALAEVHAGGGFHGDAVAPSRIEVGAGAPRFSGGVEVLEESPYRAPEVAEGGPRSAIADVFSAGAICYEILTGKHPYAGESLTGVLVVDFEQQPDHLRQKRRDISGDLADAIMACVEKDPDWRAKDLDYVIEMLQKAEADGSRSKAPFSASARPGSATRPPRAAATATRTPTRPPKGRAAASGGGGRGALVGIGAVALLGALGGGAWYYLNGQGAGGTAPPPSTAVADAATPDPEATPEATPEPGAAATPAPTPEPAAAATPTPTPEPAATPTPAALATPPPTPAPTPAPTATPAPTPTPAPAATPTPPPAPAGPAVLSHLSPPDMQARPSFLVDVRGTGLRQDHQAVILRGGSPAPGFEIVRQRYRNPELLQLLLNIDPSAAKGDYALVVRDASGTLSNPIPFKLQD